MRALRTGDVLVVWKLDRLGRTLAHLVNTVQDLSARGVGRRVLTGQGAQIDTTPAAGRHGGRKFALSKAQVRLAQAARAHRDTSVSALCRELGITPVTLYRYVGPQGQLREQGEKVLAPWTCAAAGRVRPSLPLACRRSIGPSRCVIKEPPHRGPRLGSMCSASQHSSRWSTGSRLAVLWTIGRGCARWRKESPPVGDRVGAGR